MKRKRSALPPSVAAPYTGGHTVLMGGYRLELCPDHPKANAWGYVSQHRLVAERGLGRYLQPGEVVHHIDSVKANNDPANLQVLPSKSAHMALHRKHERDARKYGPVNETTVREALSQMGLKAAAQKLGVSTQTIRNYWPDLVKEFQRRRSPGQPTAPETVGRILDLAQDPTLGYREIADLTGTTFHVVRGLCRTHNFEWTPKSSHPLVPWRAYRGKRPKNPKPPKPYASPNEAAARSLAGYRKHIYGR
jgi:hypothetical protein